MKLYGIVNCNTVKAARAWLDAHGKRYDFIDFKKTPPTPELLQRWCDDVRMGARAQSSRHDMAHAISGCASWRQG